MDIDNIDNVTELLNELKREHVRMKALLECVGIHIQVRCGDNRNIHFDFMESSSDLRYKQEWDEYRTYLINTGEKRINAIVAALNNFGVIVTL